MQRWTKPSTPSSWSLDNASTFAPVSEPHPLVVALQPLIDAAGAVTVAAADVTGSDVALKWDSDIVAVVRLPEIHGSLDRLIAVVEAELGAP